MFGNFNLNAGLSQLQDLGGKFQKIREDLEQNIESSLRSSVAPGTDSDVAGFNASADGGVSFAGTCPAQAQLKDVTLQLLFALRNKPTFRCGFTQLLLPCCRVGRV